MACSDANKVTILWFLYCEYDNLKELGDCHIRKSGKTYGEIFPHIIRS